jgi:hypothetical protein
MLLPGGRPTSSEASTLTSRCYCGAPSPTLGECRKGLGPCRDGGDPPPRKGAQRWQLLTTGGPTLRTSIQVAEDSQLVARHGSSQRRPHEPGSNWSTATWTVMAMAGKECEKEWTATVVGRCSCAATQGSSPRKADSNRPPRASLRQSRTTKAEGRVSRDSSPAASSRRHSVETTAGAARTEVIGPILTRRIRLRTHRLRDRPHGAPTEPPRSVSLSIRGELISGGTDEPRHGRSGGGDQRFASASACGECMTYRK